jgi:hypothetical protein
MEIVIQETYGREGLHINTKLIILSNILFLYIQGDSGRNVSILGGDSTCHCERKVHVDMGVILNDY